MTGRNGTAVVFWTSAPRRVLSVLAEKGVDVLQRDRERPESGGVPSSLG